MYSVELYARVRRACHVDGLGVVLAAEFIACTGDIRRFGSADALASAAGLAPV